ncbi:M23 family metallopeptidase [Saccharopolyspora antimicrobica]|nr:M23 family metallopeptidase [Saccharopolyspora antimicrobica]
MLTVVVTAAITSAVSAVFGGTPTAGCTPTGVGPTDVSGYGPEQLVNAATVVAIGKQMNIPERGWIIALATALQESGLRNLNHGDRDSLGLFQQRPSQGWGTPAQITDPAYAATQFYRHLLAVPGWQQMSINDAAQAVQRSGFPHAYARHEPAAHQFLATVHGSTCTATPTAAWTIPVTGQCTSGFGPRGSENHRGQDIAAPIGTPIVAASNGTVIDSGPARGYGLWVRIEHTNGVITTYGHNNRNLVQPGQEVQAGQPIAEVGNRGESSGPHLHFQIDIGGQALDPVAFYQQQSAPPLCS